MNEPPTGKERGHSSPQVWGERLIAAIVGGTLTSAALLWTSSREMGTRQFEVRTQRETAVRTLQGELLNTLSGTQISEGDDFAKVVFLGALHGNFSEQFDTRTVFEAYAQQVKDPVARRELRRLAERVSRRQSEYLKAHGGEGTRCVLDWVGEVDDAGARNNADSIAQIEVAGHHLLLSLASKPIRRWDIKHDFEHYVDDLQNSDDFEEDQFDEFVRRQLDEVDDLGIDDVADVVEVRLRMREEESRPMAFLAGLFVQKIEASLQHEENEDHGEECGKTEDPEDPENRQDSADSGESDEFVFDATFELSYMDSPYIDNIWVLHDGSADRIAVLLRGVDKYDCPVACESYRVQVEVLHFPDDLLLPVEQAPAEEVVSGQHDH